MKGNTMKPAEIETQSFTIIDKEAGGHKFTHDQWNIVRRIIHTSADFDYMNTICFSKDSIAAGIQAIRSGKTIITDTRMARSGIRKQNIERFGGRVLCLINDSDVAALAEEKGTTRAQAAVDLSAREANGGIYAVGNAPTALIRLIELVNAGTIQPALILGFPVGFVNAAESKALLRELPVPYITNIGRKGGSTIVASVVNALIILTEDNR
jgi:precorrin-8X/cobalt-precorrin-8 methylmutase